MKIRSILLILLLFLSLEKVSYALESIKWEVKDSTHFLVYYCEGNEEFAKGVSERAEDYFNKITKDMGYTRYGNFWLWERRCRIYIYPDQRRYMIFTGSPGWSAACADYKRRKIRTFQGSPNFLASSLPHELTHVIFREAAGLGKNIPLWLDEGIAQYEEKGKIEWSDKIMEEAIKRRQYIPAKTMMRIDSKTLMANSGELVELFYAQSISMVGYLIEKKGSARFANLCYHLKSGKSLNDALKFAYFSYNNFQDLYNNWLNYWQKEKGEE